MKTAQSDDVRVMVQRKIFDPNKEEVRGGWRTHCIMKINVFDDRTNISKVIK